MSKSPKPVEIACPHCRGAGRTVLSPAYAATLALLRRQRQPVNGAALARLAGTKEPAMCNRLVVLSNYGLAVGTRNGREVLWAAAKGVPGA
jgi:predicted transcriptional regulator